MAFPNHTILLLLVQRHVDNMGQNEVDVAKDEGCDDEK